MKKTFKLNTSGHTKKVILGNPGISVSALIFAKSISERADVLGIAANQISDGFKYLNEDWVFVLGQCYRQLRILWLPTLLGSSNLCIWQKEFEGCLSLPGKSEIVSRANYIIIRWFNGIYNTVDYRIGPLACIYQHEADHLKGITINTDGIKTIEKLRKVRELLSKHFLNPIILDIERIQ